MKSRTLLDENVSLALEALKRGNGRLKWLQVQHVTSRSLFQTSLHTDLQHVQLEKSGSVGATLGFLVLVVLAGTLKVIDSYRIKA